MNVSFDLNYLLVFGLAVCIIILIYMLIKHIFVTERSTTNLKIGDDTNEKNLSNNIDFFNKSIKIIEKSNKIIDKENNKSYQIIDLGDKILIMEDTLYFPQEESKKNENEVINSKPLEIEVEQFQPEQINSAYEKEILSSPVSDAEDMKRIIEESGQNYDDFQKVLYNMEVNGANNISEEIPNDKEVAVETAEEEEEEEEDNSSHNRNHSDNNFL